MAKSAKNNDTTMPEMLDDFLKTQLDPIVERTGARLSHLPVAQLVSLLDAFEAAAHAFRDGSNQPRNNGVEAGDIMFVMMDSMFGFYGEVIDELARRRPTEERDIEMRARALLIHKLSAEEELADIALEADVMARFSREAHLRCAPY